MKNSKQIITLFSVLIIIVAMAVIVKRNKVVDKSPDQIEKIYKRIEKQTATLQKLENLLGEGVVTYYFKNDSLRKIEFALNSGEDCVNTDSYYLSKNELILWLTQSSCQIDDNVTTTVTEHYISGRMQTMERTYTFNGLSGEAMGPAQKSIERKDIAQVVMLVEKYVADWKILTK
jgi:hypothetical protein